MPSMTSIPILTTNVKVSYPPHRKTRKDRKAASNVIDALPHFASHENAPTLPQLQQAISGAFARLVMLRVVQQMEGNDGR